MLIRVQQVGGVVTWQSPLLAKAKVPHGFTARHGGISAPSRDTLHLSLDPDRESALLNRLTVLKALDCAARRWVGVRQVHGADVHVVNAPLEDPMAASHTPCGDAMITTDARAMLGVLTADCVPILLADKSGDAVAAVHAGWRGTAAGIVTRTVETLTSRFNLKPTALLAAVGPCISVDAFEVGPEVVEAFVEADLKSAVDVSREQAGTGKAHVDLRAAVTLQLTRTGMDAGNIDQTDRCTYRDADDFFSYRRDGAASGRQAAVIGVHMHGDLDGFQH